MKSWLLFFIISGTSLAGKAQWSNSGNNIYTTTSNVGIGTSSPQELFHVYSNVPYPRAIVQSTNSAGAPGFAIADATGTEVWTWQYNIAGGFMGFFLAGTGNTMVITNAGNVGIGTTNPYSYRLAVNGSAIFTSAWVKPSNNWPDYVFKKGYSLPSLDSLSAYIQAHRHLPDIPSADSIQAKGIDLGGNQAALLKKIEELTLYAIDQDKILQEYKDKFKSQEEQVKLQAQQTKALEERLQRLEKRIKL